jgi:hypothetical protein
MRTIIVSTDVFAALWAKRRPGEDSENAVLERLLGLPKGPPIPIQAAALSGSVRVGGGADGNGGIYNRMFDVRFPAGFEIFRTYKGRDYSATVRDGRWVMGGESFPSLFALSTAIVDSRENPWMHWKYRDANGRVNMISALRKIPPELDDSGSPDAENPRSKAAKNQTRKLPKKTTAR